MLLCNVGAREKKTVYYESVKQTQQRPNKRGIQAAPHDYHFHSSVRGGVLLWAKPEQGTLTDQLSLYCSANL
eukprot:m.43086 g.43086  ORF g.43086 m.43086 type:complete len:72 (+) comp9948_c0_seq1:964-1179(+)